MTPPTTPTTPHGSTPPVPVEELGRVHMIGVGGAGMSVIARLLAARGVAVQGSDAAGSETLATLREAGVTVWVGHDASHVAGADTVVVSSAVRESNPELAAARAAGLRVLHRSQALAALMLGNRGVAVAGAHGKTTTSAMIATILREAGVDASFAIGSSVRTATGSVPGGHLGAADVLVAEADESDGSFLNYAPTIAVVTNVEPDHLDHWGTQEAFAGAFVQFAGRVVTGGTLVACADDPGALSVAATVRETGGRVVTYGTAAGADVRIGDVVTTEAGASAVLRGEVLGTPAQAAGDAGGAGDAGDAGDAGEAGGLGLPLLLSVPGAHNVLNATAAVVTAVLLGVEPAAAVAGVAAFVGTGRRFESRGEAGGVRVVDDYGHHPTEIEALLRGARPVAGDGRIIVLFQPHLYSRTRIFAERFAQALSLADEVVVTGVYRAREDVDPDVSSRTITDLLPGARSVEDRLEAAHVVAGLARPGDLVLTVGAGDVTELGPVILADLAARAQAGSR